MDVSVSIVFSRENYLFDTVILPNNIWKNLTSIGKINHHCVLEILLKNDKRRFLRRPISSSTVHAVSLVLGPGLYFSEESSENNFTVNSFEDYFLLKSQSDCPFLPETEISIRLVEARPNPASSLTILSKSTEINMFGRLAALNFCAFNESKPFMITEMEPTSPQAVMIVSKDTVINNVNKIEEQSTKISFDYDIVHWSGGIIGKQLGQLFLAYIKVFHWLGSRESTDDLETLRLPRGTLLHGPPGSGKSYIVKYTAQSLKIPVMTVFYDQTSIDIDIKNAVSHTKGCIVIHFDQLDTLTLNQEEPEAKYCLFTLQALLDETFEFENPSDYKKIIIVATATSVSTLDRFRRSGRFDREMVLGTLDESDRLEIYSCLYSQCKSNSNCFPNSDPNSLNKVNIQEYDQECLDLIRKLALKCVGYLLADAFSLVNSIISSLYTLKCLKQVLVELNPPSASLTRGLTLPNHDGPLTWNSLGGIDSIRDRVRQAVEWPILHADALSRMGISPPRGILLHGPPGCSKTTIARVIAATTGVAFYPLMGGAAALYSAYVGEAEAMIRNIFDLARKTLPAIIFIDEIDAIVGRRGSSDEVSSRVLTTILNELDGISSCKEGPQIMLLAATNRIDSIDEALLRPGRLDLHIEVPLPDREGRRQILEIIRKRTPFDTEIVEMLVEATDGSSGADLTNLVQRAALAAIGKGQSIVTREDFIAELKTT